MASDPDAAVTARQRMLDQHIRERGLHAEAVLQAMSLVPREEFVPAPLRASAYEDQALDIGEGQTISQPYIVAYMTATLDLHRDHRVLEIGTGSGYQTAILSLLCGSVYTVEALPGLAEAAQRRLQRLGCRNCHFRTGDGSCGWPEEAPFDRIIVTAGAPWIPTPLVDQLRIEGKMILPVGSQREQRLILVERRDQRYVEYPLIGCRFVKLLGRYGWPVEETKGS
jgi:protein-L-isoaspartate(D-aspartate) O-methyltransferase